MKVTIEKIQIDSFGKLKNCVVSAENGINILSAPNETGKSTLAAFIKYAFYGFVGSRRHELYENDRKLFTPWDGEICEGKIAFTADGEKYILHRRTSASGKDTCELVNRVTGKTEFAGMVPGEAIFGVTEAIFIRTLFFRQLTTPQPDDDVLADRLRDIAISADEQVSTKKALKKLNDAKNELKGKSANGLIPKATAERDALEEKITVSEDLRRESDRLRSEITKRAAIIKANEEKLKSLYEERKNIENYQALLKLQNLNRLAQAEDNARKEYEAISAGMKKQADSNILGVLTAQNAELIAEQRNAESIKSRLDKAIAELNAVNTDTDITEEKAEHIQSVLHSSKKLSVVFFAVAAICLLGGGLSALFNLVVCAAGIALGAVFAGLGFVWLNKPKKLAKQYSFETVEQLKDFVDRLPQHRHRGSQAQQRVAEIQEEYENSLSVCRVLKQELEAEISSYIDSDSDSNFSQSIEKMLEISVANGEKLALWQSKKEEYDAARENVDIEALAENAKNAHTPEREPSVVDMEINFYTKQTATLSDLNRRDELDLAAFEARSGDISVLVGKRDSLNNSIAEYTLKHKAYEKAMELINTAGSYMKAMVSPRISAQADEYFTLATDGKYSGFSVDTHVAMSFGADVERSCDYLSAGTRDSAYLSLRLALADLLFADGAPMLLDDAFVRLDDDRLAHMLKAVGKAAENHQIFILTHGDREQIGLSKNNIPFNEMELKSF